jgi:uncharacterized protein YqeY
MATLSEQITEGWKDAMREGQTLRKDTLSILRAAVKRAEIDGRGTGKSFDSSDDAQVQAVIEREAKKRRDAIEEYAKVGREDRAQAERDELEILLEFLPQQLSEEEIRAIVQEAIAQTGASSAKDLGPVMKAVTPKTSGRADGKQVNAIVRELLGS